MRALRSSLNILLEKKFSNYNFKPESMHLKYFEILKNSIKANNSNQKQKLIPELQKMFLK